MGGRAAPPVHHGELALGGHGVSFDQKGLHLFGSLTLLQKVETPEAEVGVHPRLRRDGPDA
jgi:hypothetical protein